MESGWGLLTGGRERGRGVLTLTMAFSGEITALALNIIWRSVDLGSCWHSWVPGQVHHACALIRCGVHVVLVGLCP